MASLSTSRCTGGRPRRLPLAVGNQHQLRSQSLEVATLESRTQVRIVILLSSSLAFSIWRLIVAVPSSPVFFLGPQRSTHGRDRLPFYVTLLRVALIDPNHIEIIVRPAHRNACHPSSGTYAKDVQFQPVPQSCS